MNTIQLKRVLMRDKYTQKYFINVFASDQLPKKITHYPACLIVNLDSSTQPGSHWIAFYMTNVKEIEMFDSYGNSPELFNKSIKNFVSKFNHVTYNPVTLQSNISAVCGQYCIYYLYCKCRGRTLRQFLSYFTLNNVSNDKRVYNFVSKRFHVQTHFFQ